MVSSTRRRVVAAPARRPPAELRSVRIVFKTDSEPDTSYLFEQDDQGDQSDQGDQGEFADRRAAYERGEWSLIGCCAEAEVVIEEIVQTLTSGGLYGIESDSEQEYLDEIIAGEWIALRNVLKTVGVSTDQLPLEVDPEWIEWRAWWQKELDPTDWASSSRSSTSTSMR
jgi:hypothetical protein